MIEYSEIVVRLVVAAFAGGLIGLEREFIHKPAGLRTHMLVCVGSCLFILAALESVPHEVGKIIAGDCHRSRFSWRWNNIQISQGGLKD